MQPASHKIIYIFLTVILILTLISTTVTTLQFLGKTTFSQSGLKTSNTAFFDSISGFVAGKVVSVDNNKLTIENKNGERQTFDTAAGLTLTDITDQTPGTPPHLNRIELNKEVTISFVSRNGIMEINNISSVTPPIAPPPPLNPEPNIATGSANNAPTPPPPTAPKTDE